jgi:multicomponent Na+:H+ antiporter subunit G
MVRLPDTYTRLHTTNKAVVLGVISLLAASSVVTGDSEIVYRVLVIGVFLVLTTPGCTHVIARAAYWRGERMESRRVPWASRATIWPRDKPFALWCMA